MAIQVGSVEVDVVPNTRGIYNQLRTALVPAATRAGEDAGAAAGRSFGPAMQREIGAVGVSIGQQIGSQIASRITAEVRGALRDGVNQGGREARAPAARQGEETGGAFSRSLRARLEVAFRSLPQLQVGADTTEADSDLQALRARMETLAGQRIGIDIDAAAARAEIRILEAQLERLGAQHPNVQVRADTAAARAQLALVHAEIDAVDGKRARIDVDTSGALSAIFQLTVAIGGLAAIPAIPVLAAGIGAIASAGVAAGAGVGALAAVAVPAFINIAGALQAQKAAQEAATSASNRGAQAGAQAASRALQMAGAQQALATAERNGARQIAQAQQQVRQAKTAAADAIVQAAQRNAQAARQVQDAERALAQSQKAAKQAQADLTDARREAGRELEDLANQYANAQLSQRDAALGVQEAQQRLAEVQASGSKASALERQQAQLAYEQAVQRLREQTTDTQRLKEKQEEASKSGVEGTSTYQRAQEQLVDAQQGVADKTEAVQEAQVSAARTQVESARQITQAQERVGEATSNVAVAQQSAADAVASAQRQIASASASAAGGVDQAALAQSKYQEALAKLTPSARGTFDAFQSLRTAFKGWSESLQPAVMPIFTRALEGIKNSLPGLTPFVLNAAKAIGILQDKISAGFKSEGWKSFRDDLAAAVLPATVGLGTAIGNVFKTMGGIVDAFLPHMDSISERMQSITGRWAGWATGLKGSDKFTQFLAYASRMGPVLAESMGKIAAGFFDIGRALEPLSGPLLKVLGALFTGISYIATEFPGAIQLMYGIFIATRLWAGALLLLNAAMWLASKAMTVFNFISMAGPWGWIILAIVAVVAAIVWAYSRFDWVKTAVDAVWSAIKTGAAFVWSILQPILSGIWTALQFLGSVALSLWENAIRPAFTGIWLAARILFAILFTIVFTPLLLLFKLVAAIVLWMWEDCFRPALEGIGAAAMWVWNNWLKPVFGWIGDAAVYLWREKISPAWENLKAGMRFLGERFREFWNDYVKPVFNWIAEKAIWLYETQLRPAFDKIKTAVGYVKDAFSLAKDGIKTAWDQLVDITRRPVQIIVDTVYNKGIRPVWNAVAKIVRLGELDEFKFDQGGVLPGYTPGRDPHTFYSPTGGVIHASGGEAFMRPEFTRAVGSGWVGRMNAAARAGGVGGVRREMAFKDGGILDKIVSGAKTVGGWIGDGVDVITNPTAAWEKATGFIREAIAGISGNPWASAVAKLPIEMLGGLKKTLVDSVSSLGSMFTGGGGGGGPVGGGVSRWTGVVQQALQMVGQPLDYTGITLRRMEQESGGNPNIVNKWDSNWLAGYPSVGLMQVIGPTFRAYAGAMRDIGPFLYGTSVNPLANVYASMRYALAQYGSLPRAYNRAGGYDSGGYLQPGLNLAYNGTGRPEPVFTTSQANALTRMATAPTAGLGPGDELRLVVDGHEFAAYVDHRADGRVAGGMRQLAGTAQPGRKG